SVYNMVSSILSRDIYQGWIKPQTTDEQLLTVGRAFSVAIGLIVVVLAVIFVTSQFGIFNLMQAFFTLLNIPVVVPTAFGLLFRRVPKWAALGSIVWGLIMGLTTRYALMWDIGPQVYIAFVSSLGIFAASWWTGNLYKKNKVMLVALCAGVVAVYAAVFFGWLPDGAAQWQSWVAAGSAAVLGISLYGFSYLFASETPEQRAMVMEFFKKLDTPVDVAKEVFGAGRKQISTFPLVGGTTMVMGVLMSLILFTDISSQEKQIMGTLVAVMIIFGVLMWYFGKKSEIRSAAQYAETKAEKGKRQ
ncbi:MAG: sodium solute transporter superfamily, partial [Bacteroidetes bacterium]|nr:sodium solute transporter superfamily [Bacteroidota bacterium]